MGDQVHRKEVKGELKSFRYASNNVKQVSQHYNGWIYNAQHESE